jgi:hypothetical protein
MDTGVSYNKLRLHRTGYFAESLRTNEGPAVEPKNTLVLDSPRRQPAA